MQFDRPEMDDVEGKIFIGGLSWQTTETTLRIHFEKFGELCDVAIMSDKRTGQPRGFGFIKLKNSGDSELVVSQEHIIDGRRVDVKKAVPRNIAPAPSRSESKKVFVGGLIGDVTDQILVQYFSRFGTVKDGIVMVDRLTSRSRGFGFVTFESEEVVLAALSATNEIMGKWVDVKRAEPREGREDSGAQIHHHHQQQQHPHQQTQAGTETGTGTGTSHMSGNYGRYDPGVRVHPAYPRQAMPSFAAASYGVSAMGSYGHIHPYGLAGTVPLHAAPNGDGDPSQLCEGIHQMSMGDGYGNMSSCLQPGGVPQYPYHFQGSQHGRMTGTGCGGAYAMYDAPPHALPLMPLMHMQTPPPPPLFTPQHFQAQQMQLQQQLYYDRVYQQQHPHVGAAGSGSAAGPAGGYASSAYPRQAQAQARISRNNN